MARRSTVAALGLGLAATLLLSGCAAARPARPIIHDEPTPAAAMLDNYGRIRLPIGGRVLVIGDDLVGQPADLPGAKLKSRGRASTAEPFTVRLKAALGPSVELITRTRPGARADAALAEFSTLPQADAIIMVFGPGDLWGGPTTTPFAQFSETMRLLIDKAQASGSLVILVAPPLVSNAVLNGGVASTYRTVIRERAHLAGADVVEFKANFTDIRHVWSDGVHLATPGSRALANFLAGYFVTPTAASTR